MTPSEKYLNLEICQNTVRKSAKSFLAEGCTDREPAGGAGPLRGGDGAQVQDPEPNSTGRRT